MSVLARLRGTLAPPLPPRPNPAPAAGSLLSRVMGEAEVGGGGAAGDKGPGEAATSPAEETVVWSPEVEVCLFHAMLGHKPVGEPAPRPACGRGKPATARSARRAEPPTPTPTLLGFPRPASASFLSLSHQRLPLLPSPSNLSLLPQV